MTNDNSNLTLAQILSVTKELLALAPVIYYFASDYAPDKTCVYKIPNPQARAGYDLAFHPSLLEEVLAEIGGAAILRPMDNTEERRRSGMVKLLPLE
jgi:hypothetical protein